MKWWQLAVLFFVPALRADEPAARLAERSDRKGDEIVVCGQPYHTTTRVVLWTDPGGYDAYRVEPRIAALDPEAPKAASNAQPRRVRFGMRQKGLTPDEIEKVRGGGWDLPTLARVVDQLVIHFDAAGTSKRCFQVLDRRGLSVHFLLDLDGTIYQTLDAKESAWHATIANGRSIGVEVANIGAYPIEGPDPLAATYRPDSSGKIFIAGTDSPGPNGAHILRPRRDEQVVGTIQGQRLKQYDFTSQQYEALAKLAATLCNLFPRIRPDYPRDEIGALVTHKLSDADYARYHGILGHYHVQSNKVDPGPAFQWEMFVRSTRELLK
jgi:N-acetylmuramoyl-L-alanine amidase